MARCIAVASTNLSLTIKAITITESARITLSYSSSCNNSKNNNNQHNNNNNDKQHTTFNIQHSFVHYPFHTLTVHTCCAVACCSCHTSIRLPHAPHTLFLIRCIQAPSHSNTHSSYPRFGLVTPAAHIHY